MFKWQQLILVVLALCLSAAGLTANAQTRRKWAVVYEDVPQEVIVYQTEAGEQRLPVPVGFFYSYSVAVSPRGRYIAFMLFGEDEAELKVYELKSGRLVVDSAIGMPFASAPRAFPTIFNTDETRIAVGAMANYVSQGQDPLPVAQGKLLVYDLTTPQTVREPLLTLTSREAAELAAADTLCVPVVRFFIGELVIWHWWTDAGRGGACFDAVFAWNTGTSAVSSETLPLPSVTAQSVSEEYANEEYLRAIRLNLLEDMLTLTAVSPSRPELVYGGLELALRTPTGKTLIAPTPNFAFAWFVQNGDRLVSFESADPLDETFFLSQIFPEMYQDVLAERRYTLRLMERNGTVLFAQTVRTDEPAAVPYGPPSRDGVYYVEYNAEGFTILHVSTLSGTPSDPEQLAEITAPNARLLWLGDSE
ncbi:MAG: hypothetical protein NZ571_13850 [Anaerolineae bacterium]|nr:hypothetical protein [Anaerolineae bacterium]